jgi:UDP-N-acetyl-D-mannosaminuronic acid dehydrogenase
MVMAKSELKQKIDDRTARLAVIGLGYVGLPVACEFARAGFDVLGIEQQAERVKLINQGISPIEGNEPGLAELLAHVVLFSPAAALHPTTPNQSGEGATPGSLSANAEQSGKLRATSDYQELDGCDIVLIDVETPVDEFNIPRYGALRSALTSLGKALKPGMLVIVESTIAPGTMYQVVEPLLTETSGLRCSRALKEDDNSGIPTPSVEDFYLGNCPERVMPGKLLANLRNVSRVVGGMTPETADTMVVLYKHIVQADLDPTDCITAELVKTVENAYRDVQIAFANEVALICEAAGGDVWKVRPLVNKSPFRQMHFPGAGVGGHCIPKDPWLLAYGLNGFGASEASQVNSLQLIPAARHVNDSMPLHMADLTVQGLAEAGCEINEARIIVMGYAYLEDSDDTRNSPSARLVARLQSLGAEVIIHDPYVAQYQGDLLTMAHDCDAAVVMVQHSPYRKLDLKALKSVMRNPVLIDGRKVFDDITMRVAGWIYRAVGQSPTTGPIRLD